MEALATAASFAAAKHGKRGKGASSVAEGRPRVDGPREKSEN